MRNESFTLIELILVTVLICILGVVALIRYGAITEKAYSAEAYSVLGRIASAENVYKMEYGTYTASLTDLDIDDPVSPNFTYSIHSSAAFARASRGSGFGRNYCMYFESGLTGCPSEE